MRKDIKKFIKSAKKAGIAVVKETPNIIGKTVKTLDTTADRLRDSYNKQFQPRVQEGINKSSAYLNKPRPILTSVANRSNRMTSSLLYGMGTKHRIFVVMQRPDGSLVSNTFYDPIQAVEYIKKTKSMKYKLLKIRRE
jgi:hypothetical protein